MSEPAKSARSPALEGPKFECLVNPHQYERILKRRAARERYANERGFKVKYANGLLSLHPKRSKAARTRWTKKAAERDAEAERQKGEEEGKPVDSAAKDSSPFGQDPTHDGRGVGEGADAKFAEDASRSW